MKHNKTYSKKEFIFLIFVGVYAITMLILSFKLSQSDKIKQKICNNCGYKQLTNQDFLNIPLGIAKTIECDKIKNITLIYNNYKLGGRKNIPDWNNPSYLC